MSSINLDPDSAYGQHLKAQIATKLRGLNLTEDPEYVAEFLLVLISNNRTPDEILHEFQALFGDAVDANFISEVLQEVKQQSQQPEQQEQQQPQPQQQQQLSQTAQSLEQSQQSQQLHARLDPQQPQQIQQQLPQAPSSFGVQSTFQPSSFLSGQQGLPSSVPKQPIHQQVRFDESGSTPMEDIRSTPVNNNTNGSDIISAFSRGNQMPHGITKGGNFKSKKSFALRNQQNFDSLMSKSLGGSGPQTTHFVPRKPLGRCKHFPYCKDRNCRFAHPTKVCFAYPNCPNPPGTCNYLHPGEDDELMAELEKAKEERLAHKIERNNNMIQKVTKQVEQRLQQQTNGIALCKFGSVCQRDMCPFGHPTPANKDAKVLSMEWCTENKNCTDSNCTKAHSSPNYKPVESEKSGSAGGVEKNLEQCKFGKHCKNFRCPKRHATTTVLCRQGANCTRIDCYFQHPIDEECKFGVNCKNFNCPFKHPEGRQLESDNKSMVWVKPQEQDNGDSNTEQRQFAVPEDQVMESAPPQEA
ncbi:hypothetical protein FOA43_000576 [Brettanomyces nanus]|uniref:Nuclear abundant poly(A) RNA-binding protein Nab2 N-terminal domain-containing protein n=1 Tax=Eeniella nana TaxID=13502 RepID=A0A875RXC8_EENNA|nr:uncharacterized protein FOA43_000576 [Brettanomyces nanus]QPG73268.1 hypothetical protein FOA43_000576 [Brettanomyces nanus]